MAATEAMVASSASRLLEEELGPSVSDGSLSKKQLRVAVAEDLKVTPESLKETEVLKKALDDVFTKFVESLEKEEEKPSALLRGKLSVDEKATWKGSWAFSKADWDKGVRSSFKLTSKKGWDSGCLEDGRWVSFAGHFTIGEKGRKEKEISAKLKFLRNDDKYEVHGLGKNGFGSWKLEYGIYEPKSGRFSARRKYDDDEELTTNALTDGPLMQEDDEDEDYDEADAADDDDEDEEGEAAAAAADGAFSFGSNVAMRGVLECVEKEWIWSGKWAANGQALEEEEGGSEEFRLTGTRSGDKVELSGTFDLRFQDESGEKKKRTVPEPRLVLKLSKTKVKGRGRNEFGEFSISGHLAKDGVLSCSKKYATPPQPGSDDDDDDDEIDADEKEALAEELAELEEEAKQPRESTTLPTPRRLHEQEKRRRAGDEMIAERKRRREQQREHQEESNDDIVKAAMRDIQKALAAGKFDVVKALLLRLKAIEVTVDLLADTGVGKFVNRLKKHENDQVSQVARALVAKWKKFVQSSGSGD